MLDRLHLSELWNVIHAHLLVLPSLSIIRTAEIQPGACVPNSALAARRYNAFFIEDFVSKWSDVQVYPSATATSYLHVWWRVHTLTHALS